MDRKKRIVLFVLRVPVAAKQEPKKHGPGAEAHGEDAIKGREREPRPFGRVTPAAPAQEVEKEQKEGRGLRGREKHVCED